MDLACKWQWTWGWTVPMPAQFGDNPIADWIRVICVVMGVILAMWILRVIAEQSRREVRFPPTQYARLVALLLADLSISLTEVSVVGTPATPRLVVNVVCVATGWYGVRGMRHKQLRQPIVK